MKLHEIHQDEFTEGDIPIIFNLLQNLLRKRETIHYIRFKGEDTVVEGVKIDYDDIREVHHLTVTLHDRKAKSHAYQSIAWEIPKMTDRLVLEKRPEGWFFFDPEWMSDTDYNA